MPFEEPKCRGARPGPLWLLLVYLLITAGNLYLLCSLSHWWVAMMVMEMFLAVGLAFVALLNAVQKRWPTALQLLLWSALASVWILQPLRARVIDHKVRQAGTAQLLRDARTLVAEVAVSDRNPEDLDPNNLLVPASFRRLNPRIVRVGNGSVMLVHEISISSIEAILIDTDPAILPGPVVRAPIVRAKDADWETERRLIAPGIEYYSSST